jgi:hypothetical protein
VKNEESKPSIQESFERRFNELLYNTEKGVSLNSSVPDPIIESEKYTEFSIPAESHLDTKIQESLKHRNWDEAYSLVIANSSKSDLLELLKYCEMPKDKLVQDCLFVELRKNLEFTVVLRWLQKYMSYCEPSVDKIRKLYNDLSKLDGKAEEFGKCENELKEYKALKGVLMEDTRKRIEVEEKDQFGNGNNYSFKNRLF